jgi:hypothetical protein
MKIEKRGIVNEELRGGVAYLVPRCLFSFSIVRS